MPRARKGAARTQARRKLLREARGFYGTKSRHKQQAKVAMMRAKRHAWRDRRARKRDFRALWIQRINAAARGFGLSFDHFGRSSSPQNHALTQHFAGRLADAGLIREVSEIDGVFRHVRDDKGRFSMGGMASKLSAIRFATDAGIETHIANGRHPNRLAGIIAGNGISSKFHPAGAA